jgi:outer membrane protein assembly factor BamE
MALKMFTCLKLRLPDNKMKTLASSILKSATCISLCLFLSACFIRPYKFDITQGNLVTADTVEQLQTGMTEEQVQYLLGTPMLHDVFHTNRWDYIYYEKPGYGEPKRRHLAIYFEQGRVERITRDEMPASVA